MGGRYCAVNSPLGPRWGQKSLDLRSRDFCPHLEPRGELIAQYRPPMSFRYKTILPSKCGLHNMAHDLFHCVVRIWTVYSWPPFSNSETFWTQQTADILLAPSRQPQLTWTYDDHALWRHLTSLGHTIIWLLTFRGNRPSGNETCLKNMGSLITWIQ